MTKVNSKLDIIIDACEDLKGHNITSISLENKTDIADNFIIASANTATQTKAMANRVEEKMEEAGYTSYGKEGYREGNWIVLDYFDTVVHIFTNDTRNYYNLERLWA